MRMSLTPLPNTLSTSTHLLHSHHTVVRDHESFLLLFDLPTPHCRAVILFTIYESVSVLLVSSVCSLEIPRMSEIIWNLSVSDWLISLSIMLSRSTSMLSPRVKFSSCLWLGF